jgi:hypothetical protein
VLSFIIDVDTSRIECEEYDTTNNKQQTTPKQQGEKGESKNFLDGSTESGVILAFWKAPFPSPYEVISRPLELVVACWTRLSTALYLLLCTVDNQNRLG